MFKRQGSPKTTAFSPVLSLSIAAILIATGSSLFGSSFIDSVSGFLGFRSTPSVRSVAETRVASEPAAKVGIPTASEPAFLASVTTIAAWNNNSLSGVTSGPLNATTIDANLSTASLSRGSGVTATSLAGGFASSGWVDTTEAGAIANNRYCQSTITAKSGFKASLATLDSKLRRTSTGPNAYVWRYSTDGTNFTDIGTPVSFTTTTTSGDVQPQINLSSIPGLQNVANTATITLRLYAWGATGSAGTFAFGTGNVNSLAIAGSVEPQATSSATKLAVTSIAPASPTSGNAFNVTVQAEDGTSNLANVVADTGFTISTNGNAGALGGTTAGTINAGSNQMVVSGVILSAAGTGVTLTATQAFGDSLTAGTSSPFNVIAAATPTPTATPVPTPTPTPTPTTGAIVISQVFGGGGNSGSTYTNDFIELHNNGSTPVDITFWSVQYSSNGTTTWTATPLCATGLCMIQPGGYYLVKESAGAGGTTALPNPDVAGTIAMGAGSAKVALVNTTTALSGSCPSSAGIMDLVGYGSADTSCFEGSGPTPTLTNLLAAIRKQDGCVDTNDNSADFLVDGPMPRNSASPVQTCGGDTSQLFGYGMAKPSSVDPASTTVLSVTVSGATGPNPSSGISVRADLSSIGGSASQIFYDDGSHGDVTAGDNVFSFATKAPVGTTTGSKSIPASITDAQSRSFATAITLTVQSPTCGVERWAVKTGTDADAGSVDLTNKTFTTVQEMRAWATPGIIPVDGRIAPYETTVWVIDGTLTLYKLETDVDYHMVIQDAQGNTVVTEIPLPGCVGTSSPFANQIASARAKFDSMLTAGTSFKTANLPVRITGIGMFDFIHGQTGVAPNGIELHPIIDISFKSPPTVALSTSSSSVPVGQSVTFTANVQSSPGGTTPTGVVNFLDGSDSIGIGTLDDSGNASLVTSSLAVGTHSITASYAGDGNYVNATSAPVTQEITKRSQTITFNALANRTYGDPDFDLNASASSGLAITYSAPQGDSCIVSGGTVHITAAGSCTITASQNGDTTYNAAESVMRSFSIGQDMTAVSVMIADGTYDGDQHGGSAVVNGAALAQPLTISYSGRNSTVYGPSNSAPTEAGDYTASASFSGDANHLGSSNAKDFTIRKASSTTSVTCEPGPFTYTALAQTPCTAKVEGAGTLNQPLSVNFGDNIAAGTATASASYSGDSNHDGSQDSKQFVIGKADATITVTGFDGLYDEHAHGIINSSLVGADGESPSGLVIDNTTYTNVPGGLVHWTFSNPNYNDQRGDADVKIAKADQNITFQALNNQIFGASDFGIMPASSSGLPVSLEVTGACSLTTTSSVTTVHITGAGNCSITATQGGNGNFNAATPVVRNFSIAAANQLITFAPLANATFGDPAITLAASGGGSGNPVTFAAVGNCSVSSSTLQITGAGSCTVTASQAGNSNFNPAADVTRTFSIGRAQSGVSISIQSLIANGGSAIVSATLMGVAGSPLPGQTVGFSIGSGTAVQTCSALSSANGVATCTITGVTQPLGPNLPVAASFSGNVNYFGSSAATSTLVFAYAAGGGSAFVVGDRNSAVGGNVTFWGSQWAALNELTGGPAPSSFKGFANRSSVTPAGCGATWTTDEGNASNPPSVLPSYMAVAVSSSITKSASTISGDTMKIVIVKTNAGYAPDPSHTGTGTVVGTLCQ